jgi:DNA-binding NarL/FixJ family response regulator
MHNIIGQRQRSVRVMIVDDSVPIRAIIKRRFQEQPGIDLVAEGVDGLGAELLLEAHRPDVVVMDGRMPFMDGPEATARLMAIDPQLRVIGHSSDPSLEEAMRFAGASGFVIKGDLAKLVAMILEVAPIDRGTETDTEREAMG